MLILSQNREVMVNMENIHSLSLCKMENFDRGKSLDKRFRILAWFGSAEDDFWNIGNFGTKDRAKEVIREIWQKYGEYLHRCGGPAILRGTSDVPEAFWVLPKIYEMPEV